jgi:hypothetical protein
VGQEYGWDAHALEARVIDASTWFVGLCERLN